MGAPKATAEPNRADGRCALRPCSHAVACAGHAGLQGFCSLQRRLCCWGLPGGREGGLSPCISEQETSTGWLCFLGLGYPINRATHVPRAFGESKRKTKGKTQLPGSTESREKTSKGEGITLLQATGAP